MNERLNIDLYNVGELINKNYYKYLDNTNRNLVLYGGAGSGKSYFAAQKVLVRTIEEYPHKIACYRKVAKTLRNSVFALMKQVISDFELTDYFTVNKTDMTITFKGNGNQIICLGLDDPEKIKSIHGITSDWLEEITEFTKNDLIQINLRLRGKTKHYKQHILSFNPISISHWLKKHFFDSKQPKTTIFKSTYKDNEFIDEEYKSELENLKNVNKTMHDIYALGEWGLLEGLIYTNWHVIDEMPQHFDDEGFGLDFGYNNPSALVHTGYLDQNLYLDEIIYQTKLTNGMLIDRMTEETSYQQKMLRIICDSAEPQRIEELRQAGFNVQPCIKGTGSVKHGIGLMQSFKIFVTKRSANLIKELQSYSWAEDKEGNPLDEPVKMFDHGLDGTRYFVSTKPDLMPDDIDYEDLGFEQAIIDDRY